MNRAFSKGFPKPPLEITTDEKENTNSETEEDLADW